jgi:ABC-2 type transport system permease protein
VTFAQASLYRGACTGVVWPQFVAVAAIGVAFLILVLLRFRKATAAAVT